MEIKNPDEKTLKDLQLINLDNYHTMPPKTPRGDGLFLFWMKQIDLTVVSSNKSYIDRHISNKRISFHTTFVYGKPEQPRSNEMVPI